MKNRLNKFMILAMCLSIGLFSCKKETDTPPSNPGTIVNPGKTIVTSIGGIIVDENDDAVAGATVTIGSNTKQTDARGLFMFNDIPVNELKAYVKVEKNGYFLGSRNVSTKINTVSSVRITMLSNSPVGNFSAAAGGIITSDGVTLDFPLNSVKMEDGTAYTGTVNVALQFLDPNNTSLLDQMPGDLTAINSNGDERALETYGMVAVELTSTAGQKLNVADGKKVEITIPLSGAYLTDAPSTMPLWFFDEANGVWKEEGLATKVGNNYVGEVSHFTFWNFDWPNPFTFISGKVECDTVASTGALVLVKNSAGRVMGADYTDNMGNYNIRVPQGMALDMEISQPGTCNLIPYYTSSIGSFSSTTTLATISACSGTLNTSVISATLQDCNGNPVTNGVLEVQNGVHTSYFFPNSSGVVNASLIYCSATSVTVVAHDFTNFKSSIPQPVSTGATMSIGVLSLCNTAINEYINYTLDGTAFSMLNSPGDSLSIYQTGNITQLSCVNYATTPFKEVFFSANGASVGTFATTDISVNSLSSSTPSVNVSFTAYGTTIGAFITGTFSGTFVDNNASTTHTISGSFNLKRDF